MRADNPANPSIIKLTKLTNADSIAALYGANQPTVLISVTPEPEGIDANFSDISAALASSRAASF